MIGIASINSETSINEATVPVLKQLREFGCVLIKPGSLPETDANLATYIILIAVLFGQRIASSASYITLQARRDKDSLAIHTEGIYARAGITPYFALGCVKPSETGGMTNVYDARKAACLIRSDYPEIVDVDIEYSSASYVGEKAIHPLCEREYLRYRGLTFGNRILQLPRGYTEDDLYGAVEHSLKKCLIASHTWERGDILLVDNKLTLHGRMPYEGERIMVRVRFDDPLNTSLRY
ncbi:MAG: TauD/TfdA family dioxygenase [Minisyncoccia bacterium]